MKKTASNRIGKLPREAFSHATNRQRLFKKFPYIVAWGQMLGSFGYYIEGQCQKAEIEKAPVDATFRGEDGKWRSAAESEHIKTELDFYIRGEKGGVIPH